MSIHYVLAKVIEGSRVEFILGHEAILSRTRTYKMDEAKLYPVGSYVTASFVYSSDRRRFLNMRPFEVVRNPSETAREDLLEFITHLDELPESIMLNGDQLAAAEFVIIYKVRLTDEVRATNGHGFSHLIQFDPHALFGMYEAAPAMFDQILADIFEPADPRHYETFSKLYGAVRQRAIDERETVRTMAEHESPSAKRDSRKGMMWLGEILVHKADVALFDAMYEASKKDTANILIVGPSGCGKTSIPFEYARTNALNVVRMNCAAVRDPEEWFGYREAIDGSTKFVPTQFTKTLQEGNAVIILDEFNRAEPWLHNTLLPLLDGFKRTTIHNEEIVCGPNVIFVATVNQGARFTGTFVLDAALINRFDAIINVTYLNKEDEIELLTLREDITHEQAESIVTIVNEFRKCADILEYGIDVSTRTSLKIAKLLAYGVDSVRTAISYALLNGVDDDQVLKAMSDIIIANSKSV